MKCSLNKQKIILNKLPTDFSIKKKGEEIKMTTENERLLIANENQANP